MSSLIGIDWRNIYGKGDNGEIISAPIIKVHNKVISGIVPNIVDGVLTLTNGYFKTERKSNIFSEETSIELIPKLLEQILVSNGSNFVLEIPNNFKTGFLGVFGKFFDKELNRYSNFIVFYRAGSLHTTNLSFPKLLDNFKNNLVLDTRLTNKIFSSDSCVFGFVLLKIKDIVTEINSTNINRTMFDFYVLNLSDYYNSNLIKNFTGKYHNEFSKEFLNVLNELVIDRTNQSQNVLFRGDSFIFENTKILHSYNTNEIEFLISNFFGKFDESLIENEIIDGLNYFKKIKKSNNGGGNDSSQLPKVNFGNSSVVISIDTSATPISGKIDSFFEPFNSFENAFQSLSTYDFTIFDQSVKFDFYIFGNMGWELPFSMSEFLNALLSNPTFNSSFSLKLSFTFFGDAYGFNLIEDRTSIIEYDGNGSIEIDFKTSNLKSNSTSNTAITISILNKFYSNFSTETTYNFYDFNPTRLILSYSISAENSDTPSQNITLNFKNCKNSFFNTTQNTTDGNFSDSVTFICNFEDCDNFESYVQSFKNLIIGANFISNFKIKNCKNSYFEFAYVISDSNEVFGVEIDNSKDIVLNTYRFSNYTLDDYYNYMFLNKFFDPLDESDTNIFFSPYSDNLVVTNSQNITFSTDFSVFNNWKIVNSKVDINLSGIFDFGATRNRIITNICSSYFYNSKVNISTTNGLLASYFRNFVCKNSDVFVDFVSFILGDCIINSSKISLNRLNLVYNIMFNTFRGKSPLFIIDSLLTNRNSSRSTDGNRLFVLNSIIETNANFGIVYTKDNLSSKVLISQFYTTSSIDRTTRFMNSEIVLNKDSIGYSVLNFLKFVGMDSTLTTNHNLVFEHNSIFTPLKTRGVVYNLIDTSGFAFNRSDFFVLKFNQNETNLDLNSRIESNNFKLYGKDENIIKINRVDIHPESKYYLYDSSSTIMNINLPNKTNGLFEGFECVIMNKSANAITINVVNDSLTYTIDGQPTFTLNVNQKVIIKYLFDGLFVVISMA